MTILLAGGCGLAGAQGTGDLLLADFEGPDYGDWVVTGEAFGAGPSHGTLPNQMPVSGFEGQGLVNTYFRGDVTVGTLTSPPFTIERQHLNLLLGGGCHPGETCMNLLVGGEVVRTATGPNDRPGGTERLDWHSWEVEEFLGQPAQLQIVDAHRGGWGHINVDQITQSDTPRGVRHRVREVRIDRPYLSFVAPVRGWPPAQATLSFEGQAVYTMPASGSETPYAVTWGVSRFRGRAVRLDTAELPTEDGHLALGESFTQSDEPRGILIVADQLYQETYRPQFHFTAQKGWHNDPNGLMCYEGEYHLFFQHNPFGREWGNMTWGHAVSPDLVHWTQMEDAILPDGLGTVFSGSGVVDVANTAGFQTGEEKALVCIYTSAGGTSEDSKDQPFTQSIAYSNDRGRTWMKYEGNPVLGHVAGSNRDPKVVWHAPSRKWVMALYLDGNGYALFGSPDLKEWTRLSDLQVPGASECPDFFELPVDGDAGDTRWVFWGANGSYLLGRFDGQAFTAESGPHPSNWGANCYAAQTWSNIPREDGRCLQIAWMAGGTYPDMPFNQQMSFPVELTLRTAPEGIRLYRTPVREIARLHARRRHWEDKALRPGADLLEGWSGELFEIRAEIEPGAATVFGFTLRGEKVEYDVVGGQVSCLGRTAPLAPEEGRIRLHILLDRTSIEVFGNGGLISMPSCFLPDLANREVSVYAVGGEARVVSLDVYELRSAWPRAGE